MRILIVEDSADIALLEQHVFQQEGHEVVLVNRDFEILLNPGWWRQAGIDVAVVDYMLPGASGLTIAKVAIGAVPDIRIVFSTAGPELLEGTAAHEIGILLAKPWRVQDLLEAIYG